MKLGRESGYGLLLVLGILGAVSAVVMLGYSLGTRNQAAETQLAIAQSQLQLTASSQVKLFDQFVKAGYLRADCRTGGLRPANAAPAHVKRRFAGGRFIFESCDPRTLGGKNGDGVFAGGRALTPPDCPAQRTVLTTERSGNPDDRVVLIEATSTPSRKSSLTGEAGSTPVKARIELPPAPVPTFGLLVNDLHCGMCHVKVNGDVASTSPVTKFHEFGTETWIASVQGAWYAAKSWDPSGGTPRIRIDVSGGVSQNYGGTKLPGRFVGRGAAQRFQPEFPRISFSGLARRRNPDPYSCETRKLTEKVGNTVMLGTPAAPIVLDGDIHVQGDLVIKGQFTGVGTIYVDGNVYIPFDIIAQRSIFPYSNDPAVAAQVAKDSVKKKLHDGLAIASKRSIILGEFDLDEKKRPESSVWFHPLTPPDKRGDKIGVMRVYSWYPGGKAGFDALFEPAFDCLRNAPDGHKGSINRIDAYLYAENTIGGLARRNSYAINGGIIADNFHVVSGARNCIDANHPVHKLSTRYSYVNYDWRMQYGLPLLDRFAQYFSR